MADNDPTQPTTYTIQDGDYVPKIAAERGFSDYQTIWDDSHNQKLKQQRVSPNILAPDDQLYIPARETRTEPRPTDATHNFVLSGKPLKLRLIVHDMEDKPVSGKPVDFKVTGSPDVPGLTTDGSGKAEREIQPTAKAGTFKLKDTSLPIDLDLNLKIGFLHPVELITGQKARLNNLGYDAGEINEEETPQFKSAVEEFQCDQKLAVDGICGKNTQAKLKQVHGC